MQLNFRSGTNLLLLFISLVAWWFTAEAINPELHYYLQQSAFLPDSLFFQDFARYPGGLADYVSEFISQFFYFKIFGSFLIILIASLQGIIAINLIQRIAGKVKLNFSVFALILLISILVQCNYYYPFYASIRLLITFLFVWIYTVLTLKYPWLRFLNSFLLAMLLFYMAGGAALFVFAITVILVQIRFSISKMDFLILPVFAVFAGTIPLIAYKYIFLVDQSLGYAVTHSKKPMIISYVSDYKLYTLYSLLPTFLLFALIYNKIRSKIVQTQVETIEKKAVNAVIEISGREAIVKSGNTERIRLKMQIVRILNSPVVLLFGQFTIIVLLGVYSLSFTIDTKKKNQILVSFYGANRDWVNVVKTAESLDEYDLFTNVEYNIALANTGKLAENLFNYKQLAGSAGLFLDGAVTSDVPFICSDQYYDLGFMHESQHWTFEAQTIFPNSPRLMKRLVQINLVNGKYKLAEKFLLKLNQNMLYHDWVAKYQKYINDTSLVAKDPEFSFKRKCEPLGNFTAKNYARKLYELVDANPANKMAYEYLMCSFLLDGDIGAFKTLLSENKIFHTDPLPRSWDEALTLYYYISGRKPSPEDIIFTKQSQEHFNSFIKALKPFDNDWQAARQSLQKEYGTTYWYYIKCLSPKVTKMQIKNQKFDE